MAVFTLIAALVIALDRATKFVSLATLTHMPRVVAWAGVLEWRLTRNTGMALGLLAGNGLANLVLPVAAMAAGWLVLRRYRLTAYTRVAAALVLGGFLGNLIDRVLFGFVVDMVYFPWMPWYICNLADVSICVGIALLCVSLLFRPADWQLKTEENAHEPHYPDRRR